jgi:hypothetical protein
MKKTIKFPRFDAELNTDVCDPYNNAELMLTLRLGFRQINPAGGANSGTYHDYGDATEPTRKIVKWTPTQWAAWKLNFVTSAQAFWHGKFWLINDTGNFSFTQGGMTYVPNIWCRVKVIGNEANVGTNHHTIEVVRLDRTENWFGSHSTLYDSLDTNLVRKGKDGAGKAIMQRAHVHEVGHLLGLGHVDIGKAHCPADGDTNEKQCYGVADDDKHSVMGSGMKLRVEHARPWREAIKAFALDELLSGPKTLSTYFAVPVSLTAVWKPEKVRHYPRTTDEVKLGVSVISRVKRAA